MQEKISISIDKNLLFRVNKLAEDKSIKKRSKAFELIIKEYFKCLSINDLVIMAGSNVTINPEVVEDNVKKLLRFGIKDVYIIGNKEFGILKDSLSMLRLNIHIIKEKKLLGTAGALKLLEDTINNKFFVMFINIKFDFDVDEMVKQHTGGNTIATIGVTLARENTTPDNIVVEGNKIVSYNKSKNQFTNAGVYVFEPAIFPYLPKKGTLDKQVFPRLASNGRLNSYIITEKWEYLG